MRHMHTDKGRERMQNALSHRESKIPFDLGSTAVTGAHATIVEGLRAHYGLEKRPVKVHEPYQMLGMIEDDLREALGVDTSGVFARNTMFGFPVERWKEWRTPWGQEVLVPQGFRTTVADNGDLLIYPEGDLSVPPSAKMPVGGFFFDAIIRQEPIDDERLNPADNLEEFAPVSDSDLDYFRSSVKGQFRSGSSIVANFGGTAVGDIALVPGPFMKRPHGIRDVAEWYMSTVTRQEYLHEVFDRQTRLAVENIARIHERIGNAVDVVYICGTDFGDRLVFWGGGVDTQKTLPFGTPHEVRKEVLSRCAMLGKGGGFVFTTVHNIQARTPIANVIATIDAVHEYNGA